MDDVQKKVLEKLNEGIYTDESFEILFGLDLSEFWRNKKYPNAEKIIKEYKSTHYHCNYCNKYRLKEIRLCQNPKCIEKHNAAQKARYEKQKKTLKEKYGDEKYNNINKVIETQLKNHGIVGYNNREKYKETCFEKFGCDNPFGNKDIIKQGRETRLKKYGDPNYVNPEKMKETRLKKYGDPNYNNREKFKNTIKENDPGFKKRNEQTIKNHKEKFGVDWPKQKHISHYEEYNDPEIYKKFKSVYECADYFNIVYTTALEKMKKFNPDIPKKRGLQQQLLFNSIKTDNKIQDSRKIIPPKEVDIYLPDAKLAIEYDGLLFHSQGSENHEMFPNIGPNEHLKKTQECASKGIQLFHIFENEDMEIWLSMIHNKLGLNTKIYARKCIIKEIKNSDTKEFQNSNHIQGFCAANICLGLYYNAELVSIMTFGSPRFNRKYEYELIRFCTLKNHNVIGGASKLWKYFLKKYNPKSVISYANLRFSNGGIYEKLGFTKIAQSNPNYFYFKDSNILESRHKYQKHKLADLHYNGILQCFDSTKSEPENMFDNGYRRIFDCGNLTYGWFND